VVDVLFGVSYALVSSRAPSGVPHRVTATFEEENFVSGLAVFIAYGLAGMGLVLMVLL
jgi:hypothetical protein